MPDFEWAALERVECGRMPTRILAVSTAILLALAAFQYTRMAQLRAEMIDVRVHAEPDARAALVEILRQEGPEVRRTLAWLHAFYQEGDGLQRPDGLWIDGHPDYDGIGTWIFEVYLQRRLDGDSADRAREAVVRTIQQTDEWRKKHPASAPAPRP